MSTLVFMANQNIVVMVGQYGGGKVKISKIIERALPEGSLINGVIINETNVLETIKQIWQEEKLAIEKVRLVLDSTQFQLRNLSIPKLRDSAIISVARNEFSGVVNFSEAIYDYLVLRPNPQNSRLQDILCSAVEQSYLQSYIELFQKAKLPLMSVTNSIGGVVKLIRFLGAFQKKTCVLLMLNKDYLLSVLVEDGVYRSSSRVRLLDDWDTDRFSASIRRSVAQLQQILFNESGIHQISVVYFSGCTEETVDFCQPEIRALGFPAEMIPDDPRIVMPKNLTEIRFSDIIFSVGDFIRR